MKLIKHRRFAAPVVVHLPPAPGGQAEDTTFTAHFVALPKSELKAFDLRDDVQVESFLRKVLVGFDGIVDDSTGTDQPLPFSAETVELLIEDLAVARALLQAYVDTMAGVIRGN